MRFDRINKRVSAFSSFVVAMASSLLAISVAQAECNFFTGWVDNKDGTVRDPRNGLIWKRCAEGFEFANGVCTGSEKYATWSDAMEIAKQSQFLGESNWRLPTKEEFSTVMGSFDDCKNNDTSKGQYAVSRAIASSKLLWSSSPYAGGSGYAWYVLFSDGYVGYLNRSYSGYVRLVRAGQVLGGEAASEFLQEKSDRIASYERERQRLIEQAQERKRLELEQAQERKKLAAFRKSLRDGDDTNCGPVIEVKGKLVKVAFAVANYGNEHWVKREQILSPDYNCRFVNGQYQSLR
ncbi:MAG: DUF1566 domain-containing protein [Gallionella sp.]